jgi:hypothetical protein
VQTYEDAMRAALAQARFRVIQRRADNGLIGDFFAARRAETD